MTQSGRRVTFSDATPEMIAAAKKLHPEIHAFEQITLPDGLTSVPGPFDAVAAIAVLMHLSEFSVDKVFFHVLRLLRPGGVFLFSVSTERPGLTSVGYDERGRFFLFWLLPGEYAHLNRAVRLPKQAGMPALLAAPPNGWPQKSPKAQKSVGPVPLVRRCATPVPLH